MRRTLRAMAFAFAWSAALSGCVGQGQQGDNPAQGAARVEVKQMQAADAKTFLAEHPEALLLDVRNPDEWTGELGHIEGARLIPLPELGGRIEEIAAWKERPVVAVCRSGRRSQTAGQMLVEAGFTEVYNLAGGMLAWNREGN